MFHQHRVWENFVLKKFRSTVTSTYILFLFCFRACCNIFLRQLSDISDLHFIPIQDYRQFKLLNSGRVAFSEAQLPKLLALAISQHNPITVFFFILYIHSPITIMSTCRRHPKLCWNWFLYEFFCLILTTNWSNR